MLRKHRGIYQTGSKKGELKPGFFYNGKYSKTGLKMIGGYDLKDKSIQCSEKIDVPNQIQEQDEVIRCIVDKIDKNNKKQVRLVEIDIVNPSIDIIQGISDENIEKYKNMGTKYNYYNIKNSNNQKQIKKLKQIINKYNLKPMFLKKNKNPIEKMIELKNLHKIQEKNPKEDVYNLKGLPTTVLYNILLKIKNDKKYSKKDKLILYADTLSEHKGKCGTLCEENGLVNYYKSIGMDPLFISYYAGKLSAIMIGKIDVILEKLKQNNKKLEIDFSFKKLSTDLKTSF